jgi:protein-disulfide isomerase
MNNSNKIIVPISIMVAGGLIALAVYFSGPSLAKQNRQDLLDSALKPQKPEIVVAPITSNDYIRGSRDAKLTVIEYSDTECPFCKRFHNTMKSIMAEYGTSSDKVAWVYRHFPLAMHKQAPKQAEAMECAGEIGGQEAFWDYADMIYDETPGNDGLDMSLLPVFAERINIDREAFQTCLDSGKYATKIKEAVESGIKAGANGTPYNVIILKTGNKTEQIPLVDKDGNSLGALPESAMRTIIERLLSS